MVDGNILPERNLYYYVEGTKSRKDQHKWIYIVTEELKGLNLETRTEVNLAGDRNKWRHLAGNPSPTMADGR